MEFTEEELLKMIKDQAHQAHLMGRIYNINCTECQTDIKAIDWLLAVRKYGLETANRMFP